MSEMQKLRETLMDNGYSFGYAYRVEGRVAEDIKKPGSFEVIATLLEVIPEEEADIQPRGGV